MRAVFRVDASTDIGVGHVSRCLTLAEALRVRGVEPRFICRQHAGHVVGQLTTVGMSVTALPAPSPKETCPNEDYAAWRGVTQHQDAEQVIAALAGAEPEWIIVDHYGLDARWERALRPYARRLIVIDDLADRAHECDLLIDQNLSLFPERYSGLVPADCTLLLGPRYALLREEYLQFARIKRGRTAPVERVFVFFGGSDPQNLTGAALSALSFPRLRHLSVDIVVGVNNPHSAQLQRQCTDRPGTTLYDARPHLADLMARADLAIGAAGTTTWERMCLGLPSLVVSIAKNQRPAAEALAQDGLITYLGDADHVDIADLAAAVERAVAGEHLSEQSLRGELTVDGLGAIRVAECIDPTEWPQLQLRAAHTADAALFFVWANDPQVRRHSLQTKDIPWHVHERWFRERLEDSRSRLFVLEAKSLPVGQIRFDDEANEVRIDYSIESQLRGRGWGRRLVALGMQRMSERGRLVFRADVQSTNPASAATFARLGFREVLPAPQGDLRVFRFDSALQTLPETG